METRNIPADIREAVEILDARRRKEDRRLRQEQEARDRAERERRAGLRPAAERIFAWLREVDEAGVFAGVERIELLPGVLRLGSTTLCVHTPRGGIVFDSVEEMIARYPGCVERIDEGIATGAVWRHLRRSAGLSG